MNFIPHDHVLAILAGICSISYVYYGFYIFPIALREKRIRPLLYTCIFSAVWCIFFVLYYYSMDVRDKSLWQRFTFIGNLAFVYILWFIIQYTETLKNKKANNIIAIGIWVLPLISVYKSISQNAIVRDFPFGFWFLFMEIQITIYNIAAMILLVAYYFRKKSNRGKIHALILCLSAVILMILSWLADYILGFNNSQNMIPFWLLLWLGILLLTIKKYRFINIIPEFIGKDITENIEEGIILLDQNCAIVFANKALIKMLKINKIPSSLKNIIKENNIFEDEFIKCAKTDREIFSMRINFNVAGEKKTKLTDVKVKKIFDAYNDVSGYLMIISRVKDLEQLKEQYKISNRELDVIHYLIVGNSNQEIAKMLDVTLSTVKTHIANIYDKLNINNRVELLNLLGEFNLLIKSKS